MPITVIRAAARACDLRAGERNFWHEGWGGGGGWGVTPQKPRVLHAPPMPPVPLRAQSVRTFPSEAGELLWRTPLPRRHSWRRLGGSGGGGGESFIAATTQGPAEEAAAVELTKEERGGKRGEDVGGAKADQALGKTLEQGARGASTVLVEGELE